MQDVGVVNTCSDFYVAFSGKTDLFFLKFLKSGFRHCFLFCGDRYQTFVLDPLANRIDISFIPLDVEVVRQIFENDGVLILKCFKKYPRLRFGVGIFTCVEVVKRILGISNIFIFTPFQLYKFLQK